MEQTKSLFWPVIWLFLFLPVGVLWCFVRASENQSIRNRNLQRDLHHDIFNKK